MNQSPALSFQPRIAFIQSSWHKDIVDRGREAFLHRMRELAVDNAGIDLFTVPGAFEIPLHAKLLALSRRYHAIVGCAFVVNGGIYRHDFVAHSVVSGLMQVQLETHVPIFSVILTPHHFHDHAEHQDFFLRHFLVKGKEAANACVQTLASLEQLRGHGAADISSAA